MKRQTKNTPEEDLLATGICCSCGEECAKADFYQHGNYCKNCTSLANKMETLRRLDKCFVEKVCKNEECKEGYIVNLIKDKNGKDRLMTTECKECKFAPMTPAKQDELFNQLFNEYGRPDLVLSRAHRNLENL